MGVGMENVIYKERSVLTMGKVICGICLHQNDSFCDFKRSKVRLKKRRLCDGFEKDTSKVGFKQPIQITRRPDWYWWTRTERKEFFLKSMDELKSKSQHRELRTSDNQHPLTGDLSRFKTSAEVENKEKE